MTATAWQPIATAPRDGTRVLLWRADYEVMETGFHFQTDEEDCWRFWGGARLYAPTHWQPLPPPPAQEDDDGNG